jgi:hypothetical protein
MELPIPTPGQLVNKLKDMHSSDAVHSVKKSGTPELSSLSPSLGGYNQLSNQRSILHFVCVGGGGGLIRIHKRVEHRSVYRAP